MRTLLLALTVALPLAGMGMPQAAARFNDCTDPGYLGLFPDAPAAAGLLCTEIFRFEVSTPAGPREIRAIRDISGDWAWPAGTEGGVERGAREAAAAFAALGDFAIDDVSLLLIDDVSAGGLAPGGMSIAGMTGTRTAPDAAGRRECLITLFGLSPSSTPEEIAVTTAHEIFHCLQMASVAPEQFATYGTGGAWWIEGTAEYFSAYAVSGSAPYTDRGPEFDAAVAAGTPLNAIEHAASIFFFWQAAETGGPGALVGFMRRMARSGGAAAQQAAMRSAVSDRQWRSFVEAYADADIRHPDGTPLTLAPDFRVTHTVRRNGDQTITLEPFRLQLGEMEYACGIWGHRTGTPDTNISAQVGAEGPWTDWPEELDAREPARQRIRYAALHSGDAPRPHILTIEQRASCAPCAGSDRVDTCIAGIWQMTGGGPVEWMRAQRVPITRHAESPRYATFFSDGTYSTEPIGMELDMADDDWRAEGTAASTPAFGRWSVGEGGQLNICVDASSISGRAVITDEHGSRTLPISAGGPGTQTMAYSCSERASLSTRMEFPGLPPMNTDYTWLAPEPERGAGP